MRFLSIASGSSGNCIYLSTDNTHLLFDCGISKKRIEEGLNSIDVTLSDIDGIFISHEHSDHIQALGIIARNYGIPIYTSAGTAEAIMNDKYLGDIPKDIITVIEKDIDFMIKDLSVHPFRNYHDAADPLAFRISDGKKAIAVSTDMGHFDEYTVSNLSGLSSILIEANHDVRMLENGPYPYYLKRRILGDFGHLSNENCGKLLNEILNDGLEHILLGHLSKENNIPEIAQMSVCNEIESSDNIYRASDFDISVALRDQIGHLYTI